MRGMRARALGAVAGALGGGLLLGALPAATASTQTTRVPSAASASLPIPLPTGSPSPSPSPAPSPSPSRSAVRSPSPSPTHRPSTAPKPRPATVVYRVKTTAPVYFITVDDGYIRDPRVLDLVRREHIPLTAFLIRDAAREDPGFFRQLRNAGAALEDHTLSHPDLTKKTPAQQHAQICNDAIYEDRTFGRRPTLFRPPYGRYDDTTLKVAGSCGFRYVVMWDAVEQDGSFAAIGGSLQPGMIVILHFTPSLYGDLQQVLALGRAAGLRPALLERYLPGAAAGLPKPNKH
ncbi:MAG TPA: polysaccharide deacetylase family protein [Mycobacteriales bacterium]|nr:polysaccharide deacetylase family protein [Mycobacteriales bacterium]